MFDRIKELVKAIGRDKDPQQQLDLIDIEIEKGEVSLQLLHKEYDEVTNFYQEQMEDFSKGADNGSIESCDFISCRQDRFQKEHLAKVSKISSQLAKAKIAREEIIKGIDNRPSFITEDDYNETLVTVASLKNEVPEDTFNKAKDTLGSFKKVHRIIKGKDGKTTLKVFYTKDTSGSDFALQETLEKSLNVGDSVDLVCKGEISKVLVNEIEDDVIKVMTSNNKIESVVRTSNKSWSKDRFLKK